MGDSSARRAQARYLRLAGCVGQLHFSRRIWLGRQERSRKIRALLAGRCPHGGQRNRPFPLRLLAGILDGRGSTIAQIGGGHLCVVVSRRNRSLPTTKGSFFMFWCRWCSATTPPWPLISGTSRAARS